MNMKPVIRKLFYTMLVLIIGGGVLTLLIAANGNKKNNTCAGHLINITRSNQVSIISEEDVLRRVEGLIGGIPRSRKLDQFDLRSLESVISKNPWTKTAELWFDSKNILHIKVSEKKPVARVITREGNAFYLDEELNQLPLSPAFSLRLPVFTGFPERQKPSKKDSLLMKEIISISAVIHKNEFWKAQVSQVDITSDKEFEMIPLVGDHVVKFGSADNIEEKFERLFIFYKNVMSRTGMNAYSVVDVRFEGQVVARRKDKKTIKNFPINN